MCLSHNIMKKSIALLCMLTLSCCIFAEEQEETSPNHFWLGQNKSSPFYGEQAKEAGEEESKDIKKKKDGVIQPEHLENYPQYQDGDRFGKVLETVKKIYRFKTVDTTLVDLDGQGPVLPELPEKEGAWVEYQLEKRNEKQEEMQKEKEPTLKDRLDKILKMKFKKKQESKEESGTPAPMAELKTK